MRVCLAYGRTGLWIELPDHPPVTIVEPVPVEGLPDERAAILYALEHPIGAPPLRQVIAGGGTVAVLFSDLTRPMPSDRVLPPLLGALAQAGVRDRDILLVNALGTHRPQTGDELAGMLGREIAGRYRIVQHDAADASSLVAAGRGPRGQTVRVNRDAMQATLRILTGFIEPHLFAGFSGGPKAVLPGVADHDSILDNHGPDMLADPGATWSTTYGNPVWEEMLAVARLAEPCFLLNVTLNRARQITGVFAGDVEAAHAAGVDHARRTSLVAVDCPFDIVITSNSGYPLDLNLYQAVKGMTCAARIVRRGGDIIVAAECWDGIPAHGEYRHLLWQAGSPQELLDRVMAPGFRCLDQWEAQLQAQVQLRARVHVYAVGLTDEELLRALVIPCRSIEGTVAAIRREKPEASIAVLPDGPQVVPYILAAPPA